MNDPMAPSIQKRYFSKQEWHYDDFGLSTQALQKTIERETCLLPLSQNASTRIYILPGLGSFVRMMQTLDDISERQAVRP